MSAARFSGVYAATTTPFRDGRAEVDEFAAHCAWLIDAGVAGLVPNGSLGEYECLSDSERAQLVQMAVFASMGRVPVVPGVSGKSAAEACRWAQQAAEAGAAAVMALPPTAHQPTPDEVVAHFAEIAKVGLPIIAYNNPFSTRVDLTPGLLARLAEIEQVQAVKEFSQDVRRVAQIRERAPRLEVICGCDDTLVEAMLLGATGWIAGLAIFVLFMRLMDMFWQIGPSPRVDPNSGIAPGAFYVSWLDLIAPIAVGGIWLWWYFGELQKRPLVPANDPYFEEAIEHGHGH